MTASPQPASPSVSVVIPTYNRAKLLVEALESALQQTRPPDEIVVVDDGSKDDTARVAAGYGAKVRYVQQANAGPSAARNNGFRIATGDFIALLDSDDLWAKDRLERQLQALARHPELDFLFGLEAKFSADKVFETCAITEPGVLAALNAADIVVPDPLGLLFQENFIPTSSVFFRKQCLAQVGFIDESIHQAEDYDFWLRFAGHGYRFGFINAVLCHRRQHEGNLVNQWVNRTVSTAAVLARHRDQGTPAQRAAVDRRLSDMHYDLGSRLLSDRDYPRALRYLRLVKPSGPRIPVRAAKLVVARLLGGSGNGEVR